MLKDMLEITYTCSNLQGKIVLDTSHEDFEEVLRKTEQTLADTDARNIVYKRYTEEVRD